MTLVPSERGARRRAILAFSAGALAVLGTLAVGYDAAVGSRGKVGGWGYAFAFATVVSAFASVVFPVVLVLAAPHGLARAPARVQRPAAILGAAVAVVLVGALVLVRAISDPRDVGHFVAITLLLLLPAVAAALLATLRADKR